MESYETLGVIGEGTYGVVIKARHRASGQLVAIKKFKQADDDDHVRKTSLREVRVLKQLHHPNVVALLDVFRRDGKLYLVFEYIENTILQLLEGTEAGLSPGDVRRYMYQLLRGVDYCHAHSVIHRDVKPENILVSEDKVLKVCDFGFARHLSSKGKYTDYVATRWYRAPELLVGDVNYGKAVDIWAIGCIFAEISDTQPLFPGDSDLDQLSLILRTCGSIPPRLVQTFERNPLYRRVSFPHTRVKQTLQQRFRFESPEWLEFLLACLQTDPDKRPSCAELMNLPYFTHDNFRSDYEVELRRLNAPSLAPRASGEAPGKSPTTASGPHHPHSQQQPQPQPQGGLTGSELPSLSLSSQPLNGTLSGTTTSMKQGGGGGGGGLNTAVTDVMPDVSQFPPAGRLSISKTQCTPLLQTAPAGSGAAVPGLGGLGALPELPTENVTSTLPEIGIRRTSQQPPLPLSQDVSVTGARLGGVSSNLGADVLVTPTSSVTYGNLSGGGFGSLGASLGLESDAHGSTGTTATTTTGSSPGIGAFPQLSVLWAQYLGTNTATSLASSNNTTSVATTHPLTHTTATTVNNSGGSSGGAGGLGNHPYNCSVGGSPSLGKRNSGLFSPLTTTGGMEPLQSMPTAVFNSSGGGGRYGAELEPSVGGSIATGPHLPPLVGPSAGLALNPAALHSPELSSGVPTPNHVAHHTNGSRGGGGGGLLPSPLGVNATTVPIKPRRSSLTGLPVKLAAGSLSSPLAGTDASSTAQELSPTVSPTSSHGAKKGKKKKGNAREPTIAAGASPTAHGASSPTHSQTPSPTGAAGPCTNVPAYGNAASEPATCPLPFPAATSSAPASVVTATRVRLDSAMLNTAGAEGSPSSTPVLHELELGVPAAQVATVEEKPTPARRTTLVATQQDSASDGETTSTGYAKVHSEHESPTTTGLVAVQAELPVGSPASQFASSAPPTLGPSDDGLAIQMDAVAKSTSPLTPPLPPRTPNANLGSGPAVSKPAVIRATTPPMPKPPGSRPSSTNTTRHGSVRLHSSTGSPTTTTTVSPSVGPTANPLLPAPLHVVLSEDPHSPSSPSVNSHTPAYRDAAPATRTLEQIIAANASALGLPAEAPDTPTDNRKAAQHTAPSAASAIPSSASSPSPDHYNHKRQSRASLTPTEDTTAADDEGSPSSPSVSTPLPPAPAQASVRAASRGSRGNTQRTANRVKAVTKRGSSSTGPGVTIKKKRKPVDRRTGSRASNTPSAGYTSSSFSPSGPQTLTLPLTTTTTTTTATRTAGDSLHNATSTSSQSRVHNDTGLNLTPLRDDERSMFRQRFAQYYRANNTRASGGLDKSSKASGFDRSGKSTTSKTTSQRTSIARDGEPAHFTEDPSTPPPLDSSGAGSGARRSHGGNSSTTTSQGRGKGSRGSLGTTTNTRGTIRAPTLHDLVMAPYESKRKSNAGTSRSGVKGGSTATLAVDTHEEERQSRIDALGLYTRPAYLHNASPSLSTTPPLVGDDSAASGPRLGRLRRGPGGNHALNHATATSSHNSSLQQQQRGKLYGASGATRAQPISSRSGPNK